LIENWTDDDAAAFNWPYSFPHPTWAMLTTCRSSAKFGGMNFRRDSLNTSSYSCIGLHNTESEVEQILNSLLLLRQQWQAATRWLKDTLCLWEPLPSLKSWSKKITFHTRAHVACSEPALLADENTYWRTSATAKHTLQNGCPTLT